MDYEGEWQRVPGTFYGLDDRDAPTRAAWLYDSTMSDFTVEIEKETDGRWIGEVTDLPGALAYGATREEAVAKAKALAFRVLADRLEHGEDIPEIHGVFAVQG